MKYYNGSNRDLLTEHGELYDPDKSINNILYSINDKAVDVGKVNRAASEGLLYFDKMGNPLNGVDKVAEATAEYKVVGLGYNYLESHEELCASFSRSAEHWLGVYVGPISKLIIKMKERSMEYFNAPQHPIVVPPAFKTGNFIFRGFGLEEILEANRDRTVIPIDVVKAVRNPVRETSQAQYQQQITEDVYTTIYNKLLVKDIWGSSWQLRLKGQIRNILIKVMWEESRNPSTSGNGYITTTNRDKCLINTGLLDIYGNDIYLVDYSNKTLDSELKCIAVAGNKSWLVSIGFTKADIIHMPKPITFYKDKSELLFSGSIDDFDLENISTLNHVIRERRTRFPEKYADVSADFVFDRIKSSVKTAIKISERDYRYIIPIYYSQTDCIAYLFPLVLEGTLSGTPELAMIVSKVNGFYSVVTVLQKDVAYLDAQLVCNPSGSWLDTK